MITQLVGAMTVDGVLCVKRMVSIISGFFK